MNHFTIVLSFVVGAVCLLRDHRRSGAYLLLHGALSLLNYLAGTFYVSLVVVLFLGALLLFLGARALGRPTLAKAAWLAVPALLALGWAMGAFHDAGTFYRLVEASWLAMGAASVANFLVAPRPLVRDEQILLLFAIGGMAEIGFLLFHLDYGYITRENLLTYLIAALLACWRGRGSTSPPDRSIEQRPAPRDAPS